MTFCLGMRLAEGLVGIADTRVISGSEIIQARKFNVFRQEQGCMFLMTSGLRSVRDKALVYFEEYLETRNEPFDRLFKAVNAFAQMLRQVADEDKKPLSESGLSFNIHCLVGGQMARDREHTLYLVYPEGNWVEIGKGTPYQIIGAPPFGKPVLDRTITYEDSLPFALKVGYLSFDSTRISATDVDYPIDVLLYRAGSFDILVHRFEKEAMRRISDWWDEHLRDSVKQLPSEWIREVFGDCEKNAE